MSGPRRIAIAGAIALVLSLSLASGAVAQGNSPGQIATDFLFLLVLAFALGIGVFVMILLVIVVVKFRKRKGHAQAPANPKTEDRKLEAAWTVIPALILLTVGIFTFQTLRATDVVPTPDVTVTVIGHQWYWEFLVDNGTGNVTRSIGEFTVKAGLNVKLVIESVDVAHSLYIIDFGLKVDAIPGHQNIYWFKALNPGDFQIRCAEYCGVNHYAMTAMLHVLPA